MTGRRRFLLGLGALAGIGAGASQAQAGYDRQILTADTDAAIENASLREWAAAKGLIYGAATQEYMLSSNPQFASSFVRECAMLVPEDELKWKSLRPSPNRFDFTRSDRLAQFAKTHNLLFRGHTLLWHARLPSWFKSTVNHRNARQIMLEHITKVAGHYAGQMHSWDVVNEAVFPEDGRSDSLRITPWLRFLGSDYLDLAFRAASTADP